MNPEDSKARARRITQELLTQGDLAVATEIFATDCAHHAPMPMAPGPAGARQLIAALRHAFPDLRATIEDELVEGATVMHRLTLAGTHQGAWFDLPASGRHVSWSVALILHAGPDGSFIDHWSIWDQLDLVSQIVPAAVGPTKRTGV